MKIYYLKFFFIFLFLNSNLSADYLMTIFETVQSGSGFNSTTKNQTFSRCIKSYKTGDSRILYLKSSDNTWYARDFENITNYNIQSGFYLNDEGTCIKFTGNLSDLGVISSSNLTPDTLSLLGLSDNQLNFSFAFSGILISILFLFGIFKS